MKSSLVPETELEQRLLDDPRLQAGLSWGGPRPGHPEGSVADHVAGMPTTIAGEDPLRGELRFLALIHDSFKAGVDPSEPWSPANDHAVLARQHVVREALVAHPVFGQARPAEARIFRPARIG